MTNYVSLLSEDYRRQLAKSRRLNKIRTVAACFAALMLLTFAASLWLRIMGGRRVAALQEQNRQIERQIADLKPFEALRQQLTGFETKVKSVRALDSGWIEAMAGIAQALPEGVWIERLGTGEPDKDGRRVVAMECAGNRYEDIARTIEALEGTVADEALCTTSTATGGGVRFALTLTLPAPLNS